MIVHVIRKPIRFLGPIIWYQSLNGWFQISVCFSSVLEHSDSFLNIFEFEISLYAIFSISDWFFYLLFMEISFLSWKIRQISHLIIFQWVPTILLVDLVSRINFCCYCSSTRVAVHLGLSMSLFLLLWRKEVEEMLLLFLGSLNPSLPYPKCYGKDKSI